MKPQLERMLGGFIDYIYCQNYIPSTNLSYNSPATDDEIAEWELRAGLKLPKDYAGMLLVTNGLSISWTAKLREYDKPEEMGMINLRPIGDILPIETYIHNSSLSQKIIFPGFKGIFVIEVLQPYGYTCLCYDEEENTSIQFFDLQNSEFYFISSEFAAYFRLELLSLGISGWQLGYGSGWPLSTDVKMNIYSPKIATIIRGKDNQTISSPNERQDYNHFNLEQVLKLVEQTSIFGDV